MNAKFGSTGLGFSVQSDATTHFSLSQFSSNYLNPNGLTPGALDILFSQPLSSIRFAFATTDSHQVEATTTIQLTAFMDSTGSPAIGSTTANAVYGADTFPMGTLTFTSASSFNLVEIRIMPGQPFGVSDFLVDNIAATQAPTVPSGVPEPQSYILAGIGLAGCCLARYKRSSRSIRAGRR
jgi:hypothetical protein